VLWETKWPGIFRRPAWPGAALSNLPPRSTKGQRGLRPAKDASDRSDISTPARGTKIPRPTHLALRLLGRGLAPWHMKPRSHHTNILFTLVAILSLLAPTGRLAAAEKRRPNILFILVDDQSPFDFKFYDPRSTLDSPNLSRLAAGGMVIDAAYHMGAFTGAVCTPSRHMIMSGRTVWRLPIGPGAASCPPELEKNTIGAVFNRAGYATMRTCKQGNSYAAANRQFSVVQDAVKRDGTDESGSAWHAERVLDYLGERAAQKDERPFFIYFGLSHPHDTRNGPPGLLAKYGATNHADKTAPPARHPNQPPLPTNWLPKHPFDNTEMGVRDEIAVSGVWERRDEATIRNEIGREYACVENIDLQVGRVLARLEQMGELDNTYVFYTSDHGIAIGRHGLQGKQNLYEHTWRVPMIVKGPGIKPGSRAPGNVYLGDLLATFCDLTGVPAPETNEGVSFQPVLRGQKPALRETLYGVYNGGQKPGMRSVRNGDWKLIAYESPKTGVAQTQLFNLRDNPDELIAEHHVAEVAALSGSNPVPGQTNLAADPRHAVKLAEMRALLLAEMRRYDDPWRFSDQPDDGLTPPKEEKPRIPKKPHN
jgi:choline-sulfatase